MTAIDPQIRTRHEAARIAQKKDGRTTVLLRVAEATEHVRVGPILPPLRKRVEQASSHGRDDVAGGDGVDADPVLAPFGCQVAGELDDACFGRIIGTVK